MLRIDRQRRPRRRQFFRRMHFVALRKAFLRVFELALEVGVISHQPRPVERPQTRLGGIVEKVGQAHRTLRTTATAPSHSAAIFLASARLLQTITNSSVSQS